MSIIEAAGLTKSFGKVTALDGLDLRVTAGRVCALLGPNGAGKTTAIRILATLTRPDGGRASVAGHDVVRQPGQHELPRGKRAILVEPPAADQEAVGAGPAAQAGGLEIEEAVRRTHRHARQQRNRRP